MIISFHGGQTGSPARLGNRAGRPHRRAAFAWHRVEDHAGAAPDEPSDPDLLLSNPSRPQGGAPCSNIIRQAANARNHARNVDKMNFGKSNERDPLTTNNGRRTTNKSHLTKHRMISNNTTRTCSKRRRAEGHGPCAVSAAFSEIAGHLRRPDLTTSAGLDPSEAGMSDSPSATVSPAEKVKQFPTAPGIYLMKDAQGRVIYVGKAKNLRSRASSYFHKTASRRPPDLRLDRRGRRHRVPGRRQRGRRPADGSAADQGHSAQVQPRPQGRQDVSLLADHDRRGLSPRQLHPPAARSGRQALRPVPAGQEPARRDPGLAADLQVPHLLAGHRGRRPALAVVSPVPARTRSTSARPRATCGSIARATAPTSGASSCSSTARKTSCSRRWKRRCARRARPSSSRRPPGSATRSRRSGTLNLRGNLAKHAQPEVFYVDPRKGLKGLKQILKLDSIPRTIDGVDIAHLGGNEMVGSLVTFIDGLPFKPGYRRYQIKSVAGIDDFASIREVVTRRIKGLQERDEPFPDIWLIDGGKGQLSCGPGRVRIAQGRSADRHRAGQARGGDLRARAGPTRSSLSRRSFALRLLAIRPRRGPPLRPALSSHAAEEADSGDEETPNASCRLDVIADRSTDRCIEATTFRTASPGDIPSYSHAWTISRSADTSLPLH